MSYLSAIFTGIEGYVAIESVNNACEMDIVAFYRGQRFIVETKIWYGAARFSEGKDQLVRYWQVAGLGEMTLALFIDAIDDDNQRKYEQPNTDPTTGVVVLPVFVVTEQ